MKDKCSEINKKEVKDSNSPLQKLSNEWGIFIFGFFRPLVFVSSLFMIISLYFANIDQVDKVVSIILQFIAILFVTIAAGAFYDAIRGIVEADIIHKKGASAVRNLSLARVKAKNISNREKEGASPEEIKNLVSLLEKDIANAIQEWNDILPGVAALEQVYIIMSEKESELEIIKKEMVQSREQSVNQRELSEKEKEELRGRLNAKEDRINELENEINKLRTKTNSIPLGISGYSDSGLSDSLLGFSSTLSPYSSILGGLQCSCKRCGQIYYVSITADPASSTGLCDSCKSKLEK